MNTIPASPIAQPTPKIGTRYVAVARAIVYGSQSGVSLAHTNKDDAVLSQQHDIYALLDPADAAELERLRKVKKDAESNLFDHVNEYGIGGGSNPVFIRWVEATRALLDFEAKIGGGV